MMRSLFLGLIGSLIVSAPLLSVRGQSPSKPTKDDASIAKRLEQVKKLRDAGKVATREDVAALTAFLRDDATEVRSAAVYALAFVLHDQERMCPLELARSLLDPDAGVRASAATMVGTFRKFSDDCLPVLLKAIKSDDAMVRHHVPEMLATWGGDERVIAALEKAAHDKKWQVRNNAGVVLGRLLDDVSIPLPCWLEAIGVSENDMNAKEPRLEKDEATAVRLIAVGAATRLRELSKEKPKALAEALVNQLTNPSLLIRRMAVRSLGAMCIDNPKARDVHRTLQTLKVLGPLAEDPDPAMRTEVQTAIKRIQP
jgi:HEAT repeat protein